jgi:hypothetical protein
VGNRLAQSLLAYLCCNATRGAENITDDRGAERSRGWGGAKRAVGHLGFNEEKGKKEKRKSGTLFPLLPTRG